MADWIERLATELARRWIATNARRVKSGKPPMRPDWELVREFFSYMEDEVSANDFDEIVDLAIVKIHDAEHRPDGEAA